MKLKLSQKIFLSGFLIYLSAYVTLFIAPIGVTLVLGAGGVIIAMFSTIALCCEDDKE